jgi:tRNA modification GTPase
VVTKIDKLDHADRSNKKALGVSTVTGIGIDDLLALIAEKIEQRAPSFDSGLPTRTRHVEMLGKALVEIVAGLEQHTMPVEVRSEHLRRAADWMGKITGMVDVEDLLGVIFSEFCVGK